MAITWACLWKSYRFVHCFHLLPLTAQTNTKFIGVPSQHLYVVVCNYAFHEYTSYTNDGWIRFQKQHSITSILSQHRMLRFAVSDAPTYAIAARWRTRLASRFALNAIRSEAKQKICNQCWQKHCTLGSFTNFLTYLPFIHQWNYSFSCQYLAFPLAKPGNLQPKANYYSHTKKPSQGIVECVKPSHKTIGEVNSVPTTDQELQGKLKSYIHSLWS